MQQLFGSVYRYLPSRISGTTADVQCTLVADAGVAEEVENPGEGLRRLPERVFPLQEESVVTNLEVLELVS